MIGIGTNRLSFDTVEKAQVFYDENVSDEKVVNAFVSEELEIYNTLSEGDKCVYISKLRTIVKAIPCEDGRVEYRNEFDENILTTMED